MTVPEVSPQGDTPPLPCPVLGIVIARCTWCNTTISMQNCVCEEPCSADHCPMKFVHEYVAPPVPQFKRKQADDVSE